MKRFSMLLAAVTVLTSGAALARDTRYLLKVSEVLAMPEAAGRLDPSIKFYFGTGKGPKGENRGEVVVNPKTNAANKTDEEACRWVMLSALMDLQKRAKAVGATAVVGIESYYKKTVFSSESEYECHAGTFTSGVALRGQLIK